jgi:CheY-specific phosphatase CheX
MRLEFVKAFVDITQSVCSEVLGADVLIGELSLESSPRIEGTMVTIIELSGDAMGRILLQMNIPTAMAIAERMTGRNSLSHSLVSSCVAELTGMAIGRAISWINDQKCYIQISPPVVSIGAYMQPPSGEVETLVFPLRTEYGEAVLNISFVDISYGASINLVEEQNV